MAVTGTLTLSGLINGEAEGQSVINIQWVITAGLDSSSSPLPQAVLGLATGDNTFTIPDATTLICLIPPSSNSFALVLKGVAGDTGIAISRTTATILSRKGLGVANSFVLNAGTAITGFKTLFI